MTDATHDKIEDAKTEESKTEKQPATTKWYRQPAVWAVAISITAMILSQLPPVKTWIPKIDVTVEVNESIAFPIVMGMSACQVFVAFKNRGNRGATISNLEFEIHSPTPSHATKHLKARSFIRPVPGQDPQSLPMSSIELCADCMIGESILFSVTPSPTEDEEIKRLEQEMSKSIQSSRQALPIEQQFNPNSLPEANQRTVAQAVAFFWDHFDFEPGTHKAALFCTMGGQRAKLTEFDFTLYDYHIKTFKSQPDDYKYGWGVITQPHASKRVWASISTSG